MNAAQRKALFPHQDILKDLNDKNSLSHKLTILHTILSSAFEFADRLAVAIYDSKTDLLKTYIHHTKGGDSPLVNYQAKLNDAESLLEIVQQRQPRVVNNLDIFELGNNEHTRKICQQGFKSSYTMPMFHNDVFYGFVFINSYQADVFSGEILPQLDIYTHLIGLLIINEQNAIKTLISSVKTAQDITHFRDFETGNHIERMSRYSRLIAKELSEKYELSDEYIENVFSFAALHDIGKIAIPDKILRKPGKLDEDEIQVMQTHPMKGKQIIDCILKEFDIHAIEQAEILQNIAEYHHEAVNGTGYPNGLSGDAIPLEAKIVAVADVFDALVSERPYKQAWSNDEAFATLTKMANTKLDSDCVNALLASRQKIEEIQQCFIDVNAPSPCVPMESAG